MDDSEQVRPPLFTFGPGMRAMLLMGMVFSCYGIVNGLDTIILKYNQFSWLSPSPENGDLPQTAWLSSIFQSAFIFGLPALIYANVFPKERFGYLRLNEPVAFTKVLFGALVLIFLIPVINQGATWISESITNPDLQKFEEANAKYNNWAFQMPTFVSFLFCLLANALVPAVFEELLFRAGIQQILSENARNKHIPIVATASIFAFFHADPVSLPFIFIAGLVLGYAFYWTGSLRTTIVMHFCFNGISILIEYLNQHNENVKNYSPGIWLFVVCTILSAGFFFLLWKKSANQIR